MTTNSATVKVLGTTDKIGTCDCCERTDLKKTVMLDLGRGGLVHFGVGCAARALKMDEKDVRKAAKQADAAAAVVQQRAHDEARRAEFARVQSKLDALVPHLAGRRFEQIQAIGFEAFRALRAS